MSVSEDSSVPFTSSSSILVFSHSIALMVELSNAEMQAYVEGKIVPIKEAPLQLQMSDAIRYYPNNFVDKATKGLRNCARNGGVLAEDRPLYSVQWPITELRHQISQYVAQKFRSHKRR